MILPVSRLRRWFAAAAIVMIAIVAGMYLFARWRVRNAVHEVPKKLGIEVQQTAEGFSISKSEQGRTLFKVSASNVVQFKQGGRTELHDVKITIFGKDASRYDRITGSDFEYDPGSGDITALGTVLIDLEGNPEGGLRPDQAPPPEPKNPLHLETNGLVFNRNTGNASASGKVQLRTPQASGSAMGVQYVAKTGNMTLLSAVVIDVAQPQRSHLTAERGVVTKDPRQIVLSHPRLTRKQQTSWSDKATVFLRADNTVDRVLAEGDVHSEVRGRSEARAKSEHAEIFLTGPRNQLRQAEFSGNVHLSSFGAQPAEADAGHVVLHFGAQQVLETVHAEEGVRLVESKISAPAVAGGPTGAGQAGAQDLEMTAPAMDFHIAEGRRIESAETAGPSPQIVITQTAANQQTAVTAAKFNARFADGNRLASLHGEPDAKIVSRAPGQPDRVSTSQMLDVIFKPEGGIASLVQAGSFAYVDGTRKAWAQRAIYTTADQMLVLNGAPRVADQGMMTTAQVIRINRGTGDAFAESDVKSTYTEMKAQPQGGMLASSDPIHVTSRSMVAHRSPDIADYTGNARLWQSANVVQAPTLRFDRGKRSLLAQGNANQAVSTVLVQPDKNGNAAPVTVTSPRLTYTDEDRKIVLDGGGVTVSGSDTTMTGRWMNVFLRPRSESASATGAGGGTPGQIDRINAQGNIVIVQPSRRATGDRLDYTAADDKFVLTGGPPSIFDAEHGKITGDSLTFFRRDDRVLVEGRETSPTVTKTRVAR
jgi:lipopolysaccharide export system protein LptA